MPNPDCEWCDGTGQVSNPDYIDSYTTVKCNCDKPAPDMLACPRVNCRKNFLGYCDMFAASDFVDVEFTDGTDCLDFTPDEVKCTDCGGELKEQVVHDYGADADSNRGVTITLQTCTSCQT